MKLKEFNFFSIKTMLISDSNNLLCTTLGHPQMTPWSIEDFIESQVPYIRMCMWENQTRKIVLHVMSKQHHGRSQISNSLYRKWHQNLKDRFFPNNFDKCSDLRLYAVLQEEWSQRLTSTRTPPSACLLADLLCSSVAWWTAIPHPP